MTNKQTAAALKAARAKCYTLEQLNIVITSLIAALEASPNAEKEEKQ